MDAATLDWNGRRADAKLIDAVELGLPFFKLSLWGKTIECVAHKCGGNYHAYGYDWRASLIDTAAEMVGTLNRLMSAPVGARRPPDAPSIVFVAHSMGGLLVRIAIGLELIHTSWISCVVNIGTPLRGSPAAFRTAFDRFALPLFNQVLRILHPRNHQTYIANLRNSFCTFPSLYQLFPPPEVAILYHGPERPRGNPLNENILEERAWSAARAAHAALGLADDILARAQTPVHLIFTNLLTSDRTELEYDVDVVTSPEARYVITETHAWTSHGDGTVPDYSGGYTYGKVHHPHPVVGIKHALMCDSSGVAKVLGSIL
jgi:hypothetical protein